MIGVLQFPGTNCDMDVIRVLREAIKTETRPVFFKDSNLEDLDGLVIPGGFSYGDHLRAGAIAAKMPIMSQVKKMAREGKPILGICNGFQILCDAGLLPGALAKNIGLKFVCKWVDLRVENNDNVFMRFYKRGEVIRMPIAHGEGRYVCDEKTLREMERRDMITLRYAGENPNGSMENIAGVANEEGNVMGLMPHPERASEGILGGEDGKRIFESMVRCISLK